MRLALKILDWLFNNWLSPLGPLLGLLQSLFLVDNIILIIFLLLIIIIRWWPNLLVNCSENWNLNCRRRWWWSWVGIKCKIHTVTKLVNQTYDGNWTYKYKKYQLVDIRYQTTEMLKQSLPVIQIWTLICFFIYLFAFMRRINEWESRPWNIQEAAARRRRCRRNPSFLLKTEFSSQVWCGTCRQQTQRFPRRGEDLTEQVLLGNSSVCFNYKFANKSEEDVITATASYS